MTFDVGDTFEIKRVPFYRVTGCGEGLGLAQGLWAVGVRLPDDPPDNPDMLVPVADGVGKFVIRVVGHKEAGDKIGHITLMTDVVEYRRTVVDPDGVSHDPDNGRLRNAGHNTLRYIIDRCQGSYFRADINQMSMPVGVEAALS